MQEDLTPVVALCDSAVEVCALLNRVSRFVDSGGTDCIKIVSKVNSQLG